MQQIELADEQTAVTVDRQRIERVVRRILSDAGIKQARISIAVVDDPTIHELNRRYLAHDEPTDVLSFVLEQGPGMLEGEVVASGDTARRTAEQLDWPAEDELLLYIVHGTLHLVGYDDVTPELRRVMREKERAYLAEIGLNPPGEE
jgi:probable rRNA maturation factor